MNRDELNLFAEGLLSLVPYEMGADEGDLRLQLVRTALMAQDSEQLISEWLLFHDMGVEVALDLKVWFGLSYAALGRIFGVSSREMGQILRAQRAAKLSTYPPVSKALETEEISGISCFMVEQHLSSWIDSEIIDLRMNQALRAHMNECFDCRDRLNIYRGLQTTLVKKRKYWPGISEFEWSSALSVVESQQRAFWKKISLYLFAIICIAGILTAFLVSRPTAMPNVFDANP